MDIIWDWVSKLQNDLRDIGQEKSAQLIDQFSDDVSDLHVHRAEATLPEALALSRHLKNPWLEVYFRHWEMRNRVGTLLQGEVALKDAVEFFEFAHREETIDCPQSICVTQDLSNCYANMDGPGWVEERLAVVEETMERITPDWNCFFCMSHEYVDALIDAQRYDEALTFIASQKEKVIASGKVESLYRFKTSEIDVYVKKGSYQKAYEVLQALKEETKDHYQWKKHQELNAVQEAHLLALLGKIEESAEVLPHNWKSISPMSYMRFIETMIIFSKHEHIDNSWSLGSMIQEAMNHFKAVGSYRYIVDLAEMQFHLAFERQAHWTAQQSLKIMRDTLPKLRAKTGIQETIDQCQDLLNTLNTPEFPVAPDELLQWLSNQEQRDPEREIDWLQALLAQNPNEEAILENLILALQAINANEEAITLLWDYVERERIDNALSGRLLQMLLSEDDPLALDRFIALFEGTDAIALWAKIQKAYKSTEYSAAKALAQEMRQLYPEYLGPLMMLSRLSEDQQEFAEAAHWKLKCAELEEEPRDQLWDALSFFCAAKEWDQAREVTARLGITLESKTGAFEEDWGYVWIRSDDEDGNSYDHLAHCNGPVTARILRPTPSNMKQRCNDWVVFDAGNLADPPEDEDDHPIPIFREIYTLESGGYGKTWFIDGVHPGEAAMNQLIEQVEQEGFAIVIRSAEDYRVVDTDNDQEELPGIYFFVAAPQDYTAKKVDEIMTELTKSWEHKMAWYGLAKEANKPVESHQALIERYQL